MYLYHGTDEEHFLKIKEEGFEPYTYFTPYLDSALCMGGAYVFAIWCDEYDKYSDKWELRFDDHIPSSEICFCVKYTSQMIIYNKEAENKKRYKNMSLCKNCGGSGAMNYNDDGHCFLIGGSRFDERNPYKSYIGEHIEICPVCNGHGVIGDLIKKEE